MIIRVKLVTVSIIAGAIDSMVRRKRISNNVDTLAGSASPPDKVRDIDGKVRSWAAQTRSGRRIVRARIMAGILNILHDVLKFIGWPLIIRVSLRDQAYLMLCHSQQ